MADRVSFVLGFALALFLHLAAAQTVHVVGDTAGWTVPQGGAAFYSNWAATNKFVVGDSLSFNFMTNNHDVLEVSKESFDACNSDKAIGSVITTGPATVSLNTAGVHYYICTVGRHCLGGQKLAITVSTTTTTPSNSPRTPVITPPTTTTPSPQSSHDDGCAPTPTGSPSLLAPNGGFAPPPHSSSHVAVASLSLTLLAVVLSLF